MTFLFFVSVPLMHSLIRLYHLPCSPFFILFIPHLFSCSSPIVSFLPSPIIENKKTENPGKNVYITKYCLMLSILPKIFTFDTSDLYIHLKAVLRRSKKVLSSNLQIFTRNQYSSCWLSAVISWALQGLLSIKIDYHEICMEHTAIALRKLVFRLSLLLVVILK